MNSFSIAQELLESKQLEKAFAEFTSLGTSKNKRNQSLAPNDVQAFQFAQKLATELFKAENFEDSRTVCETVLEWVQSKENGPTLADTLTKQAMGKPQLAKMEMWAGLTRIQCTSRLPKQQEAAIDEMITSEAEELVDSMKKAMEKKLVDAQIVISSAKKLRSVLLSRKSVSVRQLALNVSLRLDLDWEIEMDKFLSNIVRDLRVEKLYSRSIEESLDHCFVHTTRRSAKLCFGFGLWLNESKQPGKDKIAKFLCLGCETVKEHLFAAKIAAQSAIHVPLASDTAFKGLLKAFDEAPLHDSESLIVEELMQLDVKLGTDLQSPNVQLICQRKHPDESQLEKLAEKELELAMMMRRLDMYVTRLQTSERVSSLAVLCEARALRLLQKRESAAQVIESYHVEAEPRYTASLVFLDAVLAAELGKPEKSYALFKRLTSMSPKAFSFSLELVHEAALFGWMMGFYDEVVRLVAVHSHMEEEDDDFTYPPYEHFVHRLGSDVSKVIEQHGNDADMAIKSLLNDTSLRSFHHPITNEFEHVYKVLNTLKMLGDLYRERGLSRIARYYEGKALGVAKSRGLRGEEQRIKERLETLDALRTPTIVSVAGEGGIGIVDDEEADKDDFSHHAIVSPEEMELDVFEQHFRDVHQGVLRGIRSIRESPVALSLDVIGDRLDVTNGDDDELWYERAMASLVCLDDPEACLDALQDKETHETDTLRARAVLKSLEDASMLKTLDTDKRRMLLRDVVKPCAEKCTSDLLILRELYLLMLQLGENDRELLDEQERAFLVSSLVGLTLRAERAQMLLDCENENTTGDAQADLYLWHRLARVEDAARVQRSQVASRLNEDWVVVTIAFDLKKQRLDLCRSERNVDIVVHADLSSNKSAVGLLERFSQLMRQNLASTNGSTVEFAQKVGKTEKNKWWEERYKLEEDLVEWLDEFQRTFLGWRAVLLRGRRPGRSPQSDAIPKREDKATSSSARSNIGKVSSKMKSSKQPEEESRSAMKNCNRVVDEPPIKRPLRVARTVESEKKGIATSVKKGTTIKSTRKKLLQEDDDEKEEDDVEFPSRLAAAATNAQRRITFADEEEEQHLSNRLANTHLGDNGDDPSLEEMLLKEFSSEMESTKARICFESGLSSSIVTEALVNLCPNKFRGDISLAKAFMTRYKAIGCQQNASSEESRLPVLLCLSGCLQQIPWESLPCLDSCRVSRIPSLPFALESFPQRINNNNNDDDEELSCGFIVDPEGNLVRTQEVLRPKLEELVNDPQQNWEGIIGGSKSTKQETGETLKRFLETKSLVLYCGHGAGEEYLPREEIASLRRCAPCFLMGCSSGSRKDLGWFEPNGVVDSYALARSPLVVGNLWNVTDKDIDRFTLAVLDDLHEGKRDLVGMVAKNRKSCKLRMLVGAAPVCFGVPWYV